MHSTDWDVGSKVLLVLRAINGVDAIILGLSLLGQRPALDLQRPLVHSINWDTRMDDLCPRKRKGHNQKATTEAAKSMDEANSIINAARDSNSNGGSAESPVAPWWRRHPLAKPPAPTGRCSRAQGTGWRRQQPPAQAIQPGWCTHLRALWRPRRSSRGRCSSWSVVIQYFVLVFAPRLTPR